MTVRDVIITSRQSWKRQFRGHSIITPTLGICAFFLRVFLCFFLHRVFTSFFPYPFFGLSYLLARVCWVPYLQEIITFSLWKMKKRGSNKTTWTRVIHLTESRWPNKFDQTMTTTNLNNWIWLKLKPTNLLKPGNLNFTSGVLLIFNAYLNANS